MTPPTASMADAISQHAWKATPLGPKHTWPALLDCAAHLALDAALPTVVAWGPDGIVAAYNDAYAKMLDEKACALGRSLPLVWPEAERQLTAELNQAFSGSTVFQQRARFDVVRDGGPETLWLDYSLSPIRGEDGNAEGVLVIVLDRTAEVKAERRLHELNQELSHRVKNTLAIVSGLSRLTFSEDADLPSVRRFKDRLQALGLAQQLIFEGDGATVLLEDIIDSATASCRESARFTLQGGSISVSAGLAGKLALILHELCSNALKHGSLSGPGGAASLSWAEDSEASGTVRLEWREAGSVALTEAPRHGFGLLLIREMFRGEPGASSSLTFRPEGLACDIVLPVGNLT